MIDHYIYGMCSRISPEAPVPVVNVVRESYNLGGQVMYWKIYMLLALVLP